MFTKFIPTLLIVTISLAAHGQQKADTVIVPLAESSKIIFTVGDPADLEILRHYNFQALFDDILDRLSENAGLSVDTTDADSDHQEEIIEITVQESDNDDHQHDDYNSNDDDNNRWTKSRRGQVGQTWQSYNVDLGTNNYLSGDQFPTGNEPYAVRPWGSWYLAVNSVQRTKLAGNLFVEWGMGVSWYSFKFQEDNILVMKDDVGVHFTEDGRNVDYIKSKLSATFINASLVPVLDFGEHSRKTRIWEGDRDGFRLGIGPYVGYRISSKSKLVYEEGGDRQKEKNRDNFYLNNFRYGLRLQIGVRSTDLFINYDMNDLFAEKKGVKLNAVSFGLIL